MRLNTGGAGCFGSHTCAALSEAGHDVMILFACLMWSYLNVLATVDLSAPESPVIQMHLGVLALIGVRAALSMAKCCQKMLS